ncbi:flap endonuclease GEN-like 1 [Cornus florida]|uniref:flap endonuclease GEN-like 1 n=1 Tax=Cornus florida TaxID=4283 RepID=UPI00289FE90E|nr:flap endonuclease GEN-like 1 [Cornus florida]
MGVGGHFWDLLKPYGRTEGFDFLRNKRVAIDLSFWIVQHETAIKSFTRNPHIRLTFFRTVNLFSKFGAFPVFVADGTPSPLKSRARIARFFQASGIDLSSLPVAEEGVSVERNPMFLKCVKECVELLELLGMPVLKARGEAEALCAQLNREGQVVACITADSDAFLYGANCVIKRLLPNSKEPFECYHMSDIEAGLGMKREHLIAISLLVGNDHDLNGVPGIGIETALRFVKSFSENEILNRLHEIGRGDMLQFQGGMKYVGDITPNSDENTPKMKFSHCSVCGHPGSKKAHLKSSCEYCITDTSNGCLQKPVGYKCSCSSCDLDRKQKEQKKNENWQIKVCKKIAMEQKFPNDEIITMYLSSNQGNSTDDAPHVSWESPKTDFLVDYLSYHQHWEPSYTRQRMLPMLSTIFLRELASNPTNDMLYGQYEFDSIQRVKKRYGHQFYVVKWKKASCAMGDAIYAVASEVSDTQHESREHDEPIDLLDEADVPQISVDDGHWFLLTDEDMDLVQAAFPEKVAQFLEEKELKEKKSKRKKSSLISEGTPESSKSPAPRSVQLSITEFYRASKAMKLGEKLTENSHNSDVTKGKKQMSSPNLSKSSRRRLLFD